MTSATSAQPARAWHIGLWVAQVLLALGFGSGGLMKTFMPIDELTAQMVWPGAVPWWLVRFIGISEAAGAIGLILPAALRIRPSLTPLAALGLLVTMGLAAAFHVMRGEFSALPINFVLGGLAALVAWGRWKKAPIAPRA